jgi:hypothetical protein
VRALPAGPKVCAGCGATPEEKILGVHHVDGDHAHDVPENVEWRCRGCHMRIHRKGETKSPEHRAKLSRATSEYLAAHPEQCAKGGRANRGVRRSAEARANMSAARRVSPAAKAQLQALQEARRGVPLPDEVKVKISAKLTGVPLSEERRKAISEGGKRRWAKKREEQAK